MFTDISLGQEIIWLNFVCKVPGLNLGWVTSYPDQGSA
jgi:hypothetical protein